MTTDTNTETARLNAYEEFIAKTREFNFNKPDLTDSGYAKRTENFGHEFNTLVRLIAIQLHKGEGTVLNNIMNDQRGHDDFNNGYLNALNDVLEFVYHYENGTIADLLDAEHY